jgi:signal transduction histidine kinase
MVTMRAPRAGPLAADWAVCLLTAALVALSGSKFKVAGWLPHYSLVPLAVGQGLVLLARRHQPMAVFAATAAVGAFTIVVGYPTGTASLGVCCAAYAAALYRPGGEGTDLAETLRRAAPVMVVAVAVGLAALSPEARQPSAWGWLPVSGLIAGSWVLGYAIRTRRAYIAELKARAAQLEAEEGERAARAVVDERLRIARELHDVIGHSISLITVQAEAAARSVRTNPDAVPGFLTRISAASRQALAEMRHVLAVLRPDAEAELSPAPGLADLGELVARLNAGGLETRLDVEPMDVSPGVALTVYRIVQESLTNVLKHAGPGARAAVTVVCSDSSVRVSVHDDGAGPSGPAASTGHEGGRRGRGRGRGGRGRAAAAPRRGADGHPHAAPRRRRGHPRAAARCRAGADQSRDAHDVSHR